MDYFLMNSIIFDKSKKLRILNKKHENIQFRSLWRKQNVEKVIEWSWAKIRIWKMTLKEQLNGIKFFIDIKFYINT